MSFWSLHTKRVPTRFLIFGFTLSTIEYKAGKLKFTLEQATKAQRGSRGIALLFL